MRLDRRNIKEFWRKVLVDLKIALQGFSLWLFLLRLVNALNYLYNSVILHDGKTIKEISSNRTLRSKLLFFSLKSVIMARRFYLYVRISVSLNILIHILDKVVSVVFFTFVYLNNLYHLFRLSLGQSFLAKFSMVDPLPMRVIKVKSRLRRIIVRDEEFPEFLLISMRFSFLVRVIRSIRSVLTEHFFKGLYVVILVGIVTSILYSLFFCERLGLFAWVARLIFIAIGLCGILSNASLKNLSSGSLVVGAYKRVIGKIIV